MMMRMTIMDISVEWLFYNLDFIKIERESSKSLLEINEKDKGMMAYKVSIMTVMDMSFRWMDRQSI